MELEPPKDPPIEYPYYKLSYKLDKKHIKKLAKDFTPHIIRDIWDAPVQSIAPFKEGKDTQYFVLIDNFNDNYELNSLSDYYIEPVRVKCQFGKYPTPLEYWRKNKKHLIPKYHTIIDLREAIYARTRLCNAFRVSVVLAILREFKAQRYLDISAGWGDRLLAAILYGCKVYCGVDPNPELHPYYKKMIEDFVPPKQRHNFTVIKGGFESADIPPIKFDLVFSSPPFFSLERYSKDKEDSIMRYNEEGAWAQGFLLVSLLKAAHYLKKGGHLVLHIHGSAHVSKALEDFMGASDSHVEFVGMMYYYETKMRGMYCFRKT